MRAWPGDGGAACARAGWWFDPRCAGPRRLRRRRRSRGHRVVLPLRRRRRAGVAHRRPGGVARRRDARDRAAAVGRVAPAAAADSRRRAGAALHDRRSRATLSWGGERIALGPAASGQRELERRRRPRARRPAGSRTAPHRASALVVEALDARVFAALLTPDGWCVAVAAERRVGRLRRRVDALRRRSGARRGVPATGTPGDARRGALHLDGLGPPGRPAARRTPRRAAPGA